MKKKQLILTDWWRGNGGGVPEFDPASYFANNLVLHFDASNLRTLLQEQAVSAVPVTQVAADADKIGTVYDLGKHAFYATAQSTATRPALGGDVDNASYFDFTRSGSNRFTVVNTASYLRTIHASTAIFSLHTRIKKKQDGIEQLICASQASTTGQSGIYFALTTANRVQVFITYSSAGLNRCNYTSTKTITVADGWQDVIFIANGTSGTLIIGNTTENFSINATGSTGAATNDLFIGSTVAGGSALDAYMTNFTIINRVITSDEITLMKAWKPARRSDSWGNTVFTFDFSNTAKGWADTGKTTPITNGTAFRAWEPEETSIFGNLNRDLTTASAGVSPTYNINLQNGVAGCTWDGVDDNAVFTDALLRELGGIGGFLVVYKNTRAALGSHILTSGLGTPYLVSIGSTYPSGALGPGVTYTTVHPSGGDPGRSLIVQKNNGEFTNVIAFQRDKTVTVSTNGLKNTSPDSTVNQIVFSRMGDPSIAGWGLRSNVMKVVFWRGLKTQAEINSMIDTENSVYSL